MARNQVASEGDLQRLSQDHRAELFIFDINPISGAMVPPVVVPIKYFYNGIKQDLGLLTFRGKAYEAAPVTASGFAVVGQGSLPRPKLTVGHLGGLMSELLVAYGDLVGALVTRIRVYARHLDDGDDPDPLQVVDEITYKIGQKVRDNPSQLFLEFELMNEHDLEGNLWPKRPISTFCSWLYRGPECTWSGGNIDVNGVREGDPGYLGADRCARRIPDCKARHQNLADPNSANHDLNVVLPLGAFPGAGRPVA